MLTGQNVDGQSQTHCKKNIAEKHCNRQYKLKRSIMGFWNDVIHEWKIPFYGTPREKLIFINEVAFAVICVGSWFLSRLFFDTHLPRLIASALMIILLTRIYRIIRYTILKR